MTYMAWGPGVSKIRAGVFPSGWSPHALGGPQAASKRKRAALEAEIGFKLKPCRRYPPETLQKISDAITKLSTPAPLVAADVRGLLAQKVMDAFNKEIERLARAFDLNVASAARQATQERAAELERQIAVNTHLAERLAAERQGLHELMTYQEFKKVRSALHPDRLNAISEKHLRDAFDIFSRLEQTVDSKLPIRTLRDHGWEHRREAKNGAVHA